MNSILKATVKGEKIYIGDLKEVIHYNHSIPTNIDEIKEDVWKPFAVFESCTNYAIIHGVMAESADAALQEIADIEDINPEDIFGVCSLNFDVQ